MIVGVGGRAALTGTRWTLVRNDTPPREDWPSDHETPLLRASLPPTPLHAPALLSLCPAPTLLHASARLPCRRPHLNHPRAPPPHRPPTPAPFSTVPLILLASAWCSSGGTVLTTGRGPLTCAVGRAPFRVAPQYLCLRDARQSAVPERGTAPTRNLYIQHVRYGNVNK